MTKSSLMNWTAVLSALDLIGCAANISELEFLHAARTKFKQKFSNFDLGHRLNQIVDLLKETWTFDREKFKA